MKKEHISPDFAILTVPSSMEGLPLALALQSEGYDVVVALMSERKAEPEEHAGESFPSVVLRRRLQHFVGDGLIEKVDADKLDVSPETIAIFDFNYGLKYAEELKEKGIKGILTPPWAHRLEHDRAYATDFVRQHYPQLYLPEEVDFPEGSVDAIWEFINWSDDFWVIKPNSNELHVFVATGDKEGYLAEAESYLKEDEKELNAVTIQLQQKIYGYECVVETWYREGRAILSNVDIELKNQFSGDLPPATGCAGDLVFTIPPGSKLREITNKPFDRFAQQQNFTGLMDAGVIFSARTGRAYFLEFCPARFGYNCLYAFLDKLRGRIGEFFRWAVLGQQGSEFPTPSDFSASVRIFDAAHYGNLLHRLEEEQVSFRELMLGEPSSVWLWDVMKRDNKLFVVGANPNVAIVSASAPSAETALSRVKDLAKLVKFEGAYFRWDIDAREGLYSMLNRLDYLTGGDLLSTRTKRIGRETSARGERELVEVGSR